MFQSEKPLGQILDWVADQLILNFLFLVCCLPVVTAGGAAISLYEQEYAIWEGRGRKIATAFLGGVLRNFKKGLILALIGVAITAVGLGIWSSAVLVGAPVRIAALVIATVLGGVYFWLLGITGRYEQKMSISFRNAYLLTFQRLPDTLLLVLVNLGYPALFLVLPEALFSGYLFVAAFFMSAVAAFLSAKILLRAFDRIENSERKDHNGNETISVS